MFRFLRSRKPADSESALREALQEFEIPSFPATATRVLGMLRQENTSGAEIAEAMRYDAGLNLRILRLVNSASFGLASQVECLERAIPLLGRSKLETLLLAVAVSDAMPKHCDGFDTEAFWMGSALRATLARHVAKRLHPQTEAESFTAGLLQDLAIPVLSLAKPGDYAEVLRKWRENPEATLAEREREVLGMDHAQIGATLAQSWGLPESLVVQIASHHEPPDAGSDTAVKAVSGVSGPEDAEGIEEFRAWCVEFLSLDEQEAAEVIDGAHGEAREIHAVLR